MELRPSDSPAVSRSFLILRRLRDSFDRLDGGKPVSAGEERAALRAAEKLGPVALPLCQRHFASTDGERAGWAHVLLFHLARDPALRARIVGDLHAFTRLPDRHDEAKMRAIALIAELGGEPPLDPLLSDVESARRRSSHDIALCLGTPADVARAGDHLLDHLSSDELLDLFDDLLETEPASALVLLDELLVRDGLDEGCRHELRRRRAAARQLAPSATPLRARRRPASAVRCRAGHHRDGRRVLVSVDRQPGSRPARLRVLCILTSSTGVLVDAHYAEDSTTSSVEQEIISPLERAGFGFAAVSLEVARGFATESARLAVQAARALPRPFYLGRHVLGLRDEHLDGTARCPAAVDLAAVLDRATWLVAAGQPAQALPLLERYVGEARDDAEGHAQLGLCRLALGDPTTALVHLERATWLAPDEPLHHWNTAAAAHRAGQLGACYLALESYRAARDVAPDADARWRTALCFAGEYERLAALQHPGRSARAVAMSERGVRPRTRRH